MMLISRGAPDLKEAQRRPLLNIDYTSSVDTFYVVPYLSNSPTYNQNITVLYAVGMGWPGDEIDESKGTSSEAILILRLAE